MRSNVVLNDELVEEAMKYSRATSRRALLEEALRTFVEVRAREERLRAYGEEARKLRLRLADLRLRESRHSLLRADRESRGSSRR